MAKRAKNEVEGYVHQVSEMLKGKDGTTFSTAILQEDKTNTRLVIFYVHRQLFFRNAEKDK